MTKYEGIKKINEKPKPIGFSHNLNHVSTIHSHQSGFCGPNSACPLQLTPCLKLRGEIALKFWSKTDPKGGGARMIPCLYWGSRYIPGIEILVGHRRCLSVLFQRCITIRKPTWGLSEWWLKDHKKECCPNHCRQPYMPDCIKDAPSWSRSPMRRFSDTPSLAAKRFYENTGKIWVDPQPLEINELKSTKI